MNAARNTLFINRIRIRQSFENLFTVSINCNEVKCIKHLQSVQSKTQEKDKPH